MLTSLLDGQADDCVLADGARIGIVGGGPAGSFFAYFVSRMAASTGLGLRVDLFEPRHFTHAGPAGCNHCGGVVSESLVQLLAAEGIVLPAGVVQRGIDTYVLHMDVGEVSIEAASLQKRIAAVYRGNGPREPPGAEVCGFDRFMIDLAASMGARIHRQAVSGIRWREGRPEIVTVDGKCSTYELVAVAVGVNSRSLESLARAAVPYAPPATMKTFICEFHLGREAVEQHLGSSMHVFLLDLPRLEFAALIPKGEFATLCMLGQDIDEALVAQFLSAPQVAGCFPGSVVPPPACHCFPRINVRAAVQPYADRIVWLGDSSACKLYKDGIGSAYKTAKSAATTAVFHGVAASDFDRRFRRECDTLRRDNSIARLIFAATKLIQKAKPLRHGVLRMVQREQGRPAQRRHMSNMLWDVFTGSAPYGDILLRSCHPEFPAQFAWNLAAGNATAALRAVHRRWHP